MNPLLEAQIKINDARKLLLEENELWFKELEKINDESTRWKLHNRIESNLAKVEGLRLAYELIETQLKEERKLY